VPTNPLPPRSNNLDPDYIEENIRLLSSSLRPCVKHVAEEILLNRRVQYVVFEVLGKGPEQSYFKDFFMQPKW
jgi:hypothetical protein